MDQSPDEDWVNSTLQAAGCVFAADEARLLIEAANSETDLVRLLHHRVEGTPLEHVLGWVEFCGQRIAVGPGVFVPRRRTEFLAKQAIEIVRQVEHATVLDLCCGCGAVGSAIAAEVPGIKLHSTDIDPTAIEYARRNVVGRTYAGDLYDPLPRGLAGRVDLIVANAPYVPTSLLELLPSEARCYEPLVALDGGPDGTDVQQRIAAAATNWLAPHGRLLVETSAAQAPAALAALQANGLQPALVEHEDAAVVIGAQVVSELPVGAGTPRAGSA